MNGVLNASVSAGSSHFAARVTCRPQRISPSAATAGRPAWARRAPTRTRAPARQRGIALFMPRTVGRGRWKVKWGYWANLLRHTSFSVGSNPQRTPTYASGWHASLGPRLARNLAQYHVGSQAVGGVRLTVPPPHARNGDTSPAREPHDVVGPDPTVRGESGTGGPAMDLNYTPEDVAFRKQVRAWLEQNLPRESIRTLEQRRAWHRKLYDAGYLGMGWPKEYGGGGARPMEQAIVADEMARANAPAPTNSLGLGIVGPTIVVHGTDAQKKRYLKKILAAEELWCQLYSEPNAGSDLAALKTSAVDQGDHFIVNGQKIWTSAGAIADWGLLLARTDTKVAKHKGISCFLINMRQPGVDVRPLKQITGSSEFCEVFMTNARVEKSDQIGKLGEG